MSDSAPLRDRAHAAVENTAELSTKPKSRNTKTHLRVYGTSLPPIHRNGKKELNRGRIEYTEAYDKPRVRSECLPGGELFVRPCPYVSCQYNLYLDVHETYGTIKLNHPDREPGEMTHSCALDIADRGAKHGTKLALEAVGARLNLTRARIDQIIRAVQAKMRAFLVR